MKVIDKVLSTDLFVLRSSLCWCYIWRTLHDTYDMLLDPGAVLLLQEFDLNLESRGTPCCWLFFFKYCLVLGPKQHTTLPSIGLCQIFKHSNIHSFMTILSQIFVNEEIIFCLHQYAVLFWMPFLVFFFLVYFFHCFDLLFIIYYMLKFSPIFCYIAWKCETTVTTIVLSVKIATLYIHQN